MRTIKAYIGEYKKPEQFANKGIPLNQKEYDEMVIEVFTSNIVQNEINGLLNEYAGKIVESAKTLEEIAFCRGAIDALKTLMKKKERKTEKVSVVK